MCLNILRGKKILVTGALGFIGRTLLETLIADDCGAELYGIDIKSMPDDAVQLRKHLHFENIDIRNEDLVKKYIQENRFDGVIHLAAVSRVVDAENDKKKCIDTNFKGTKYIVDVVAENPDAWLIFGSSREVYGEQVSFPVAEDSALLPINIYGFYKLEGERIVQRMLKRYCILRFSNVYGNSYDIPERVIPKFVHTAIKGGELFLEGGEQIIDFTYIDDTVASIIKCMKLLVNKEMNHEIIHILPGCRNKITDVIDSLQQLGLHFTVKHRPARSYDVQKFVGNPEKCNRLLYGGCMQFTSLQEGLKRMVSSSPS